MQKLQYCVDARGRLEDIKTKRSSIRSRILLLQSLKQSLIDKHTSKKSPRCSLQTMSMLCPKISDTTMLSSTFFSETKSLLNREQEETIIQQILKKQRQKIQMDEEIQTAEDDLTQIIKTVETKKDYCEHLTKRIYLKTKELDSEGNQKKEKQREKEKEKQRERDRQKAKEREKLLKLAKAKSTPSLFRKIFG